MTSNRITADHRNTLLKNSFITILLPLVTAVACSKSDSIHIAGSSTVLPVISLAAEQYGRQHDDISIIVNAGGSGVGINQLGAGTIDIGMTSRHITNEEVMAFPEVNFVSHGIGRDAVVTVVSSEIYDAGITALSLGDIGSIYRGEIRNCKQLGGPDREILVVDKESSRGTRHVFMAAVLGNSKAVAPGADLVLGSNNEEQTAIVQSDAAIGMLSHAWLNEDVRGLAIIMESGVVVEPTLTNFLNNRYPVIRELLIVTDGEPQGIVRDFIDYLFSAEGQRIVEQAGYVAISG